MRIELENVSLTFQAGTPFAANALGGVSLAVEPGERLGIAGPTGSGKSTLLGIMAGILKPTTGRVLHDGAPLAKKEQPQPGRVGLSLQTPESCLFEKTVFDDVAFAPRRLGLEVEAVTTRVEDALVSMGIEPRIFGSRNPFSLSAGEQRRVALAGVIAAQPQALLLDEPTAYLDPASRRDLIGRLVAINEQLGTTIVVVGHDMDEMYAFAHRMVIIDQGRKVAEGSAAGILTDAGLLAKHRLREPGTVQLCRLLESCTGAGAPAVLEEEQAVERLLQVLQARRGAKDR
jgi:energy-coupling factor transport system ATP-binding protein